MSWRQKNTLGDEFVGYVHNVLRVDETYVTDHEDGFTYWSGDLATRIRTDQGVFRGSVSVYRVTAETDFLRARGHVPELALALEHEMDECSFSGPVYDQKADAFRLFCGIYATSELAEWLSRTWTAAVALQIAEAYDLARRLSERYGATPAETEHPTCGRRTSLDPIVQSAYGFFHPSGDERSRWLGVPEWQQAGWVMEREAESFAGDRQKHLEAKFAWSSGEGAIEVSLDADQPHPKLGNGLHVTLTVPMRMNPAGIAHMVLDLNNYEKTEYKRCHTFGSWCEHDGLLAFREFVPNALYAPEYLEELCVNMATRAIWVDERFYELKCKAAGAAH